MKNLRLPPNTMLPLCYALIVPGNVVTVTPKTLMLNAKFASRFYFLQVLRKACTIY